MAAPLWAGEVCTSGANPAKSLLIILCVTFSAAQGSRALGLRPFGFLGLPKCGGSALSQSASPSACHLRR